MDLQQTEDNYSVSNITKSSQVEDSWKVLFALHVAPHHTPSASFADTHPLP